LSVELKPEAFRGWLEAYRKAWEERNPQIVVKLFSTDAICRESPFEEPIRGLDAILDYWAHVPKTQDQVRFDYEILAVSGETGIARWRASFQRIPTKVQVSLDGIMVVRFNAENQCVLFEEWWRRQERNPENVK